MREAARRAGVSSGAPYKHFPDRDALMRAISAEGEQRLLAAMDEEMARAGTEPTARFRAMGIAYVKFAVANPSYFRVMTMPEYLDAEQETTIQGQEDAVHAIISSAQASGAMTADDPRVVSLAAHCLVYGLARLFIDGHLARDGIGPQQAEAVATAVTGVFGRGLVPRKPDQ